MSDLSDKKENFFEIRNLTVKYHSGNSIIHAVNDVSLSLKAGETLGLVGETGAGKTTIAKSVLQILPKNSVESVDGQIFFEGKDCVIAETELGDVVIAFSEYEYYSLSNDEIEQKIYDGIKSREK